MYICKNIYLLYKLVLINQRNLTKHKVISIITQFSFYKFYLIMKKYTLSILSLSLLLSASVLNTSCSNENDVLQATETKATETSNIETLDGSMWKQEGISADFYIQFGNGLFAGGPTQTDPIMVSKYFLDEGNIILETNAGFSILPYWFEDGKLIVVQNNVEEVYSYYGKAGDISLDFKDFDLLYRSNWTQSVADKTKPVLTVKFLSDGQLKYSYDEYSPYFPSYKLDQTGTYRIEKDKIYINWNDGKEETVQTISILGGGTLSLEYPEGSGKETMKFYQS